MSDPILPLAVWEEGTLQNDVPANDNSLRIEAMRRPVEAIANIPSVTADGTVYIVGAAPAGAFSTFDPDDLTIYRGGTWYAWAPTEGLEANGYQYTGSGGWAATGGGAVDSVNGQTGAVVLDAGDVGAATAAQGTTADSAVQPGDSATTLNMSTARLLGRNTGGSGAVEEITLGTNLSFSGTTLNASGGGGGGSPGGSDTNVQYNDAGAFGGDSAFTFNETTKALSSPLMWWGKGTDIARAATTSIAAATGNYVHLTGTTTITSFGTGTAGQTVFIRFAGAGTLTHNATSLILPGAANITTAANDTAIAVSEGGSNWRVVNYQKASGVAVVVAAPTVTGWTPTLNTSSPNNTTNASAMTASGGTTNQDAVLASKGDGAIQAQVANSSVTGGNKRGANAVDWQMARTSATKVASGTRSVIPGGNENTASGSESFAMGNGSSASGAQAFAHGASSTASGDQSVSIGGTSATASGTRAICLGGGTSDADDAQAFGPSANVRGMIGATSEGQTGIEPRGRITLIGSTTTATPVTLSSDGGAAASNNQLTMGAGVNNQSMIVRGLIIARHTGSGRSKSWGFNAHLNSVAGTVSLATAVTASVIADPGTEPWAVAITAGSFKSLQVNATGGSSTTIRWACYMDYQEVSGF